MVNIGTNRNKLILLLIFILVTFFLSTNTILAAQKIVNHKPKVNSVLPQNNEVINTKFPLINWKYDDEDNDPQTSVLIQVSEDSNFNDPQKILDTEWSGTAISAYLIQPLEDKRDYYIRIKVYDGKDWSDWSETNRFSVYVKDKICQDSTEFYKCSINQPYLCLSGMLIKKCSECGCPKGYRCDTNSEDCFFVGFSTCTDNTPNDECSKTKPKYCSEGNLIDECQTCSCPPNSECQEDETCLKVTKEIIIREIKEEKTEDPFTKLLIKIGSIIRSIFTTLKSV